VGDADLDLTTYLARHAAHEDLVKWGFVRCITRGNYPGGKAQYQVAYPPDIIEAIRTGRLTGNHAVVAAGLVLQCTPPKKFWYSTSPEELIERIHAAEPL
jgi:hypothetical protein